MRRRLLAIRFEGVTLRYRVPRERIGSIKEYVIRKVKRLVFFDEIEAIRDFDLSVRPGETLGVIGRNGAGKSTFFKLIARVLYPSAGRVAVAGRIAPLLELGLGFHDELTGRRTSSRSSRVLAPGDAVACRTFPVQSEFIDLPIRRLRHGRALAFAVATDVEPDIRCGRAGGRASGLKLKCRGRIDAFRQGKDRAPRLARSSRSGTAAGPCGSKAASFATATGNRHGPYHLVFHVTETPPEPSVSG
jgi:energy-coupling factor transporter ATP-binding protein EcfA2